MNTSPDLADDFVEAYGAEPATLWAEVRRQLQLRLRSIGLANTGSSRDDVAAALEGRGRRGHLARGWAR